MKCSLFDAHPAALPLYEKLKGNILSAVPDARIEVKKTQISFFTKHMFAAVSFAPVRRAKDRPEPFLTVTFGLPCQVMSPRIDAAAKPCPGRWTHHVMIGSAEEADAELQPVEELIADDNFEDISYEGAYIAPDGFETEALTGGRDDAEPQAAATNRE